MLWWYVEYRSGWGVYVLYIIFLESEFVVQYAQILSHLSRFS
jgi:hypothetical protein